MACQTLAHGCAFEHRPSCPWFFKRHLLSSKLSAWLQVRGFAGWPGSTADITIQSESGATEATTLKILRTRYPCQTCSTTQAGGNGVSTGHLQQGETAVLKDALCLPCGDGSWLEATELQLPNRRACDAQAFKNGLMGARLFVQQQRAVF